MRMKLYLYIFCIVLGNGFLIQNNVCGFSKSFIYDKNESRLGVEMQRGLIIDKQMISMTNPNRVNSTTDNEVNLKPAVFGIEFDYEIPLINKESKPIKIDSIRFINSIGEFIYVGINSDLILPDDYLVVKFKFLHNQPGDFICSFKVYTDLDNASGSMPDSIANPIFSLRGTVRKINTDIFESGCSFFYIDSKKRFAPNDTVTQNFDLCQCEKKIKIVNNGIATINYKLKLTKGLKQNFEFKEYIPQTSSMIEYLLDNRKILAPGGSHTIYINFKPSSNIPAKYDGLLYLTPESSSIPIDSIDISFESVKPTIQITAPSIINADINSPDTIPIGFDFKDYPLYLANGGLFIIDTFILSIPRQSLRSIYDTKFTVKNNILNTQLTNQLGDDNDVTSPRFLLIKNGKLPTNLRNLQYELGDLSYKYFYSELPTSEIIVESLKVRLPADQLCYDFRTLEKPFIIQIKNAANNTDYYCGKNDIDFFSNLRDSTNDFTAAMRVSGEPVMEIQHYLKEPIQTEISLYSINGMKLETIFSGMAKADLQQIRHPMSHLPPGVYLCEMIAGQFRKTMPIILNR